MLIQKKRGKLIVEIFALSVMKVAMALVFPILSLRISPNIFICLFMPTTIFILIPDIYKYNCSKLLQSKVPCLLCELILLQRFYFNLGTNTKKIKESKEIAFLALYNQLKQKDRSSFLSQKLMYYSRQSFVVSHYTYSLTFLWFFIDYHYGKTLFVFTPYCTFSFVFTLHKCVSLFKRK